MTDQHPAEFKQPLDERQHFLMSQEERFAGMDDMLDFSIRHDEVCNGAE